MSLSQIIKEQTKDGETVVCFLQNVMKGDLEGFKEGHRIRAAELLTRFGHEEARAYIREYSQPASPEDDPATRSRDTRFDKALSKAIKEDTGDGRYVSRFLLNLVDGDLRSFNEGHRIRAAAELLVRLEGIVVGYTSTRNSPKRPKAPITRPTPVRVRNTAAPVAPVHAPGVTANSAASAPGSVATIDTDAPTNSAASAPGSVSTIDTDAPTNSAASAPGSVATIDTDAPTKSAASAPGSVSTIDTDDSVGTQTESADQHSDPDDRWAGLAELFESVIINDRLDDEEPQYEPDLSMWEDIYYDPKDIEPYVEEVLEGLEKRLLAKKARREQVREERKKRAKEDEEKRKAEEARAAKEAEEQAEPEDPGPPSREEHELQPIIFGPEPYFLYQNCGHPQCDLHKYYPEDYY